MNLFNTDPQDQNIFVDKFAKLCLSVTVGL